MVRKRPDLSIDVAAAALCVILHPDQQPEIRAGLSIFAALCILLPVPLLRFLYLLIAASVPGTLAFVAARGAFSGEGPFLPFFLAASFWCTLPSSSSRPDRLRAVFGNLVPLGVSAVALAYLLFSLLDQVAPPLGRVFLLALNDTSSRVHLAAVGTIAVAGGLILWHIGWTFFQKHGRKVLLYAEGYLACRKELKRLSRKWPC